jgi:hypothetical protein
MIWLVQLWIRFVQDRKPEFPEDKFHSALLVNIIYWKLFALGFNQHDIISLSHHTKFLMIPFQSYQLSFFMITSEMSSIIILPGKNLQQCLNLINMLSKKTVTWDPYELIHFDRHMVLNAKLNHHSSQCFFDSFHSRESMTRKDLLNAVSKWYNPKLTKEWINVFINCYLDQFQTCHSWS